MATLQNLSGGARKGLPPRSYLTIINPRQQSAGPFQGAAVC